MLTEWTKRQVAERPQEARVLGTLYNVLKAAGKPLTTSWDGEVTEPVRTKHDFWNIAFNLDEVRFFTDDQSWVYVVFDNDPDELLADYTVNLEEILQPFNDWLDKNFGGN